MPYIKAKRRCPILEAISDVHAHIENAGDLNYVITALCNEYIIAHGGTSYQNVNEVMGVLECAKLELYRRVAAPYEDFKMKENGDVYDC